MVDRAPERSFWIGLLLLAAGVAMGVAAAAVLLGRDGDERAPAARRLVSAQGSLTPRVHLFGDTVTARVRVVVDRRSVNPELMRLHTIFSPYEQVGAIRVDRADMGDLARVTYTAKLRCVQRWCLPPAVGRRRFEFSPASVDYRLRGQPQMSSTHVEWPPLDVSSRLGRRTVAVAEWRGNVVSAPPASYRFSPGLLIALLYSGAAILGIAAVVLAVRAFRRRAPAPAVAAAPAVELPPLERALSLLDGACAGGRPHEQRKALELLARELGTTGEVELARTARELAWSQRTPPVDATRSLCTEVRRAIEERLNGRPG